MHAQIHAQSHARAGASPAEASFNTRRIHAGTGRRGRAPSIRPMSRRTAVRWGGAGATRRPIPVAERPAFQPVAGIHAGTGPRGAPTAALCRRLRDTARPVNGAPFTQHATHSTHQAPHATHHTPHATHHTPPKASSGRGVSEWVSAAKGHPAVARSGPLRPRPQRHSARRPGRTDDQEDRLGTRFLPRRCEWVRSHAGRSSKVVVSGVELAADAESSSPRSEGADECLEESDSRDRGGLRDSREE